MAVGQPLLGGEAPSNGAGNSRFFKVLALVSICMGVAVLYSYASADQSAVNMIAAMRPLPTVAKPLATVTRPTQTGALPKSGEVYDLLPDLYDSNLDRRPAQEDLLHELYDPALDSSAVEWQTQSTGKALGGKCGFCIG